MFNKEDEKWYKLAKLNPEKYEVIIGYLDIFVVNNDSKPVHTFNEHGNSFIFQMMSYEGFDCDVV